ncbi:Gfo/Idh/MocA family protein [Horticoccus sp. 23ND18S-11]|uniref:Gfo/Idh/MocA family protein n=1 Tax=Horticoccus sp. 23ND18S-11 TaxID=3391832 RepID=UPI0039C9A8CA
MKSPALNRRDFIRASAIATFGFHLMPASARGANERIQVGCIGVGGKGHTDTMATAAAGAAIVALCDVADPRRPELGRRKKAKSGETIADHFKDARFFTDYREMIATMPGIDAVTVSTPDHHHFHASMLAMRKGKHVYCQKPISHSIWEARRLAETAAQYKVQTQMGNQAHAGEPIRRSVELIRAGVLGRVTEVHAWTNRPIWPQGMTAWPKAEPVPKGLNWDLWIGPAPFRDYSPTIAPFNWRGYWDFGAGALGDMGCHIMDMPYWALGLTAPASVEAIHGGGTAIAGPNWSTVTYQFPTSTLGSPVKFVWYDGVTSKEGAYQHTPPEELWKSDFPTADHVFRRFDLMLVGEKGRMFFGRTRQDWVFKPETLTTDFTAPPKTLPRVLGGSEEGTGEDSGGPYAEWLHAIKSGVPALSNFAASGPFSETVLLGNLALRVGKRVQWDAKSLTAKNAPEAAAIIRRSYRKGWELA